ncbi:MAG: hypothetical protein ACFE8C_03405 [Promethearchaeota archaeon]
MSEGEGLTGVKVLAMMGALFLFWDAVTYFYGGIGINILWGILALLFAAVIFLGLKFWDVIPFSLPFNWWILLIIGVVSIIIGLTGSFGAGGSTSSYWSGTVVTMAALIDLFGERKGWKASKMMALLGAAFGVYDCIIIFMGGVLTVDAILNAVFGLILAVILIIIIFDLVDIKIPYEWWVLLVIGFVFFFWVVGSAVVAQLALAFTGTIVILVGWSGMTILIAFVLLAMGF